MSRPLYNRKNNPRDPFDRNLGRPRCRPESLEEKKTLAPMGTKPRFFRHRSPTIFVILAVMSRVLRWKSQYEIWSPKWCWGIFVLNLSTSPCHRPPVLDTNKSGHLMSAETNEHVITLLVLSPHHRHSA
jgi:hypothetical protein